MEIFNQADIVAVLIILYFTALGWVQGIMPFLLCFLTFFMSSQIALATFQGTQNILESLKIFFLLSTVLTILSWVGLILWNKTVVKSKHCTLLSRFLGAAIGFSWSSSLAAAIMVFLVLVRIDKPFFQTAKKMSEKSYLYALAENRILSNYPLYKTLKKLYEEPQPSLEYPTTIIDEKEIISTEDLEALRQDEKLQAILADEQIKKMIKEKDFGGLLSDPKIKDLLKDKAFVNKLLKLYSGMASGK
jgi:hypothetical protein